MNTRFTALLAASVLATISVQAAAGDWTGKAYYGPVSEDTSKLPDGRTFTRTLVTGYVYGDGAANPFDMLQQTCFSTTVVAANGTETEQFGYCDALNATQDLLVLSFHIADGH